MLSLIGLTIFGSAFLLFCCEPMVGKMVLPVLGGAASVWTTCVLFFQTMLLVGYVYTHLIGKQRSVRVQIVIHAALMFLALFFLPIRFSAASGHQFDTPVTWIFGHLVLSAGIPFAVISATAPLLQNWLVRTPAIQGRDPYFLYAFSNAGSLAALVAYPALVEPRLGVSIQSRYWFYGYVSLIMLIACSAALIWKYASAGSQDSQIGDHTPPAWRTRLFWLAAAFVPSALMLAVTNHLTLNIAPAPLLWVIPLAIYLLTFIIAFARRLRPPTHTVSTVTTVAILTLFPLAASGLPIHSASIGTLMVCHLLMLFAAALLCHCSLADRRPSPRHLTEFYFIVALGGVLGGIFTSIVAPALFKTILEYPLLVGTIMLFRGPRKTAPLRRFDAVWVVGYALLVDGAIRLLKWLHVDAAYFTLSWHWNEISRDDIIVAFTGLALILLLLLLKNKPVVFGLAFAAFVMALALELPRQYETTNVVHVDRNFFGVKKVLYDADDNTRKLLHGDTLHGLESLDPALRGEPLFYYYRGGAFSDVMQMFDGRAHSRIGVVGLGTGTIAAYAQPGRHITFVDIDPQIEDIARRFFTFLERCGANCDVVVGDGRFAIENGPDHDYDSIVLDAFNSDSIPAHLISREAVRMYASKLRSGGALLFHVSNRYLDVGKLAAAVALDEGLPVFRRTDDDYIVAVRNTEDLAPIGNREKWLPVPRPSDIKSWTDDFSNVVSLIRWNK